VFPCRQFPRPPHSRAHRNFTALRSYAMPSLCAPERLGNPR
jgi:hypothetical protein